MNKIIIATVLIVSLVSLDTVHAIQPEFCTEVVFIKRQAHARKGTNGTMLGQMNHNAKMGSSICIYEPGESGNGCRTVFESANGFIFDMSLSYDANKVLFSFMDNVRKNISSQEDSFHIWEINVDGTGLRQLTFGPYHDGSAVYLPDGRIVFCSTRVESFSLCQDFLAAAMYIMDADGSNMRRLEYNTLCDTTPFVLDDGSIMFTRWEYQDKNIFCVQGLWTLNPDGSRLQLFYGNTLTVPNSICSAKQIPGTNKVICTMAAHHHLPIGGIAIIDRSSGLENPAGMRTLTPEIPYKPAAAKQWNVLDAKNHWQPGDVFYPWSYCDPYPVTEEMYLVSYGGGSDRQGTKQYGLYLLNDAGSKVKLYEDAENSCFNAIPLMPRDLPHIIPGQVPEKRHGEGCFLLTDIYQGLLDKGVKRGQIKQLRIMSQTPKKYNTEGPRYHDHYPVMGHGSYYVKYCYGTVPVDENGTAYFRAPS
ncbi:MAG: PD40 domain-containing protein, partial [Anaerohalosphaera sp.]|nr:PD40 domain-containing protein [Anaerohalosphaera sp.]